MMSASASERRTASSSAPFTGPFTTWTVASEPAFFWSSSRRRRASLSAAGVPPGMTWIKESFAWTSAAARLARRRLLSESGLRPMAQTHTRCSRGFEIEVSACWVVRTGQSASSSTFAVVDPSSIRRNRPACVGMTMRSNPPALATSAICSAASPERSILEHLAFGNSDSRNESSSCRAMLWCSSAISRGDRTYISNALWLARSHT